MSVNSIDNNVDINNNNNNVDNNNNNKPEKRNPWDTVWHDKKNRNSFILHKTDGSTLHIKIGDWIKVPGRDPINARARNTARSTRVYFQKVVPGCKPIHASVRNTARSTRVYVRVRITLRTGCQAPTKVPKNAWFNRSTE